MSAQSHQSVDQMQSGAQEPKDAGFCLQAGEILEDELNLLLVSSLIPGVRLHCFIDACYTGIIGFHLEVKCKSARPSSNSEYCGVK